MADDKRHEQQLERMRDTVDRESEEARVEAEEHSLIAADRPQDEMSIRAKSSGHKKKTADKWNQ